MGNYNGWDGEQSDLIANERPDKGVACTDVLAYLAPKLVVVETSRGRMLRS